MSYAGFSFKKNKKKLPLKPETNSTGPSWTRRGISENTECFTYPSTRQRDATAAAAAVGGHEPFFAYV